MFLFKLTTNFEYRRQNQLIKHSLPRPVLPFLLSSKGLARLPAKQQQNALAANAAVPGAKSTVGSEPSQALPPWKATEKAHACPRTSP